MHIKAIGYCDIEIRNTSILLFAIVIREMLIHIVPPIVVIALLVTN